MNLADKAEELLRLRQRFLLSPAEAGFLMDDDGIMRKRIMIVGHLQSDEELEPLGQIQMIFQEQDEQDETTEAQLVRSGEWKRHQVGWLYTFINDERLWLAKANPCEKIDLCQGWITESGQLIIRRSNEEHKGEEQASSQ